MTANITRHALAKRLRNQGPESVARLAKAMRLPTATFDEFIRKPDGDALTAEQVETVKGWCQGMFSVMATGDGEGRLELMKAKASAPPRVMGIKPARAAIGAYGDPYGDPVDNPHRPGPMVNAGASKRHDQIPTPEASKIEAAKKADEAKAPPKKANSFQPLRHIFHGKAK